MEEWKEYKLGEVTKRVKVGFVGSCEYAYCEPSDNAIPMIRTTNLSSYGLDSSSLKYVTREFHEKNKKSQLHYGDILIARHGENGKASRYNKHDEANCLNVVIIEPDEEKVPSHFIKYLFDTPYVKSDIRASVVGSVQNVVNTKTIANLIVKIPNRIIQNKIISILKSLDDKIEVNRKINENLEQQAQTLFKSWLKKCEDEVTIGDLSLNITDYTKCEQKQVVLINSSDVTEGCFEHHILSENKNLKGHFKKRFQKGDILYSQVRPRNRHWGYCTFNADNYLASTQLMVIRNRPDVISSILLYQYIIEDKVWMDFTLRTETRSGTFPQGNYDDLSAIKVPFGADVKEITNNLENIYSLIYKNEQESRRLAEIRDTLLPKLMSGELKVTNMDLVNEMLEKGIR